MADIYGTNAGDNIIGSAEADRVFGWSGANAPNDQGPATDNDTIVAGGGDDEASGGGGDDRIFGAAGADRLDGGAGDDSLIGNGLGADASVDTLLGGDGDDTIGDFDGPSTSIAGAGGDDQITIAAGMGGVVKGGGAGRDSLTLARVNGVTYGFGDLVIEDVEDLYTTVASIVSGTAKQFESFDRIAAAADDFATGVLLQQVGGGRLDLSDELAGRNVGWYGTDEANDRFTSGEGDDRLRGAGGNDELNGRGGKDTVEGDAGNDTLYGEAGDDVLNGFGENDRLFGGSGLDSLFGGDGNDTLDGGSNLLVNGVQKGDTLDGGTGFNTLSYATARFGVNVDLATGQLNDRGIQPGETGDAVGDMITNFQSVIGTNKTDDLRGNAEANGLFGGRDRDDLEGRGGADTLNGGDGDDDLVGGAGSDRLIGGDGVDEADYSDSEQGVRVNLTTGKGAGGDAEGDRLSSIEVVFGSRFDDVLTGAAKNSGGLFANKGLFGGDGDDTIIGGKVSEIMSGLAESDGDERPPLEDDVLSYANSSAGVRVEFGAAVGGEPGEGNEDYGLFAFGRGGDAEDDFITGFTHFIGSKFGDVLTGYAGLFEDSVDSRIDGGGGNDTLQGGFGRDTLIGGAGKDTATWADALRLAPDVGPTDKLLTIDLARGLTTGLLESKGDRLSGIENAVGSSAADVIIGSKGANRLVGADGNDTLTGGLGRDELQGGKHADRFDFNSVKDTSAGNNRDVILDFSRKEGDRIDLKGIDADTGRKGDQGFDFIGTKKFTGDEGDLRIEKSGKSLFVYGDVDGDKDADFSIRLEDVGSLAKGDFLL